MPRRAWSATCLFALAASIASCSDAPPALDSIAVPASQADPNAKVTLQVMQQRDDMTVTVPVAWESWTAPNERQLQLELNAGPPECDAAEVEVVETPTEVRVSIRVGNRPDVEGPCAAILSASVVDVTLDTPLSGRRVIDPNA